MNLTIDMSQDFTSEWYKHPSGNAKLLRKNTFLIEWDGVTGTLDGTYHVEVKQTADGPVTKIVPEINGEQVFIDSESNLGDVDSMDIDMLVTTWRFVYEKNSITAGNMRMTSMSEVAGV